MQRLEGRVAIVTGAGHGIGKAYAQRLAAEGAAVVIADWAGPGFVDTMIGLKARSGRMVIHGRAKTEVSA